jgi:hypothetical protein
MVIIEVWAWHGALYTSDTAARHASEINARRMSNSYMS